MILIIIYIYIHTLRTHDQTSVCKCVRACVRTCVVHCCFMLHQVARSWKHLQSAKPPEPPGHAKPKFFGWAFWAHWWQQRINSAKSGHEMAWMSPSPELGCMRWEMHKAKEIYAGGTYGANRVFIGINRAYRNLIDILLAYVKLCQAKPKLAPTAPARNAKPIPQESLPPDAEDDQDVQRSTATGR